MRAAGLCRGGQKGASFVVDAPEGDECCGGKSHVGGDEADGDEVDKCNHNSALVLNSGAKIRAP